MAHSVQNFFSFHFLILLKIEKLGWINEQDQMTYRIAIWWKNFELKDWLTYILIRVDSDPVMYSFEYFHLWGAKGIPAKNNKNFIFL